MKYEDEDLKAIVIGKRTMEDVASQYNVSLSSLAKAMNRRGYYLNKRKIKIKTSHKTFVVSSISECAFELHLSAYTISKALKGQRIKTLEELGITIEEIKYD